MLLLILTSLLWAPSFPLVKKLGLDPDLLTGLRLGLAALAFAPFLQRLESARRLHLMLLGAVQLGAMYVLVHRSYAYLEGHEVALFTILTPIWVVLIDDLIAGRLRARPFGAALLAVVGAWILKGERVQLDSAWLKSFVQDDAQLHGFLLVQAANACFALGQVVYQRLDRHAALDHVGAFAWAYFGAALVGIFAAVSSDTATWSSLSERTPADYGTLLYLGLIPTALGFHLWNRGATAVGSAVLAAANNLKIPLAVVVALAFFDEPADPVRLGAASAFILLALFVGSRRSE